MILSEALNQFVGVQEGRPQQDVAEVHRFVRWCGPTRAVGDLTPLEVSDYGEQVITAGGDAQGRLLPVKEFLAFLKRQGHLQVNLSTHIKIPRSKVRSGTDLRPKTEPIALTTAGYQAMVEELEALKVQRLGVAEDIRRAAADKDVRENAPLEASRERQGQIMSRIAELEERLRWTVVVDGSRGEGKPVHVGSEVVLRQVNSGQEVTYLLVDPAEADPTNGRVSVASPVGKAIVGRRVGEEVEVVAPRGATRYQLVQVRG
ncbi:MAG: transcription elongation factor GreA [Chloroflexi bacterium]|nr:transcription elongation factor GreA [Chloroflexota bacterium]